MANENGQQRRMGFLRLLWQTPCTYNPGEMMVLKCRGVEPRKRQRAAPRRPVRSEGLVHLSMAPLHHFHHVEKSSSSNLLCRSEAFAPPIAALRRFWTIMLLVSTVEPSSPFVAVAPAACPGSRRSELRFSDARNGWTWLDLAAQLAAVALDMGKSPTSDVGRPPMPPITAQSKRLCIPIAPCVLVCSDVNLSRFSLISKRKNPRVFLPRALSAECGLRKHG